MQEGGSILLDSHAQSLSHQRVEAKARAGARQAGGILPTVKVVQDNGAHRLTSAARHS
jgi:hypothetical protein